MNIPTVEIHEFSTGIKVDRLANGGWVSRGFTGEYMNCTIDPVPPVVERSISNREFRIAEGTASRDPAVVARVVGEGEVSWSVVAIVSRGEDEVGRAGSFYRYFLARGEDTIPHILAWLEQDKQEQNSSQIRTFNPLEGVSQPHHITVEPRKLNVSQDIARLDDDIPVIFPYKTSNHIAAIRYIHDLTIEKVKLEKQKGIYVPTAWAFNVEAVEQINRFTIVRAASENAFNVLNRAKDGAAKALPLALFDEQAVKSAVKGITNSISNSIKTEYVNTLAEAIGNKAITDNHWHRIFDGQGANNALKQKIYTPQMIKLLVLRALAIPSTLPQYYVWRAEASKNKNNNVESIAQEFEVELNKKLKVTEVIKFSIVEGFGYIVSEFLKDSISIEAATSLLKNGKGLWKSQSKQFIDYLDADLNKMKDFSKLNNNADSFNLKDKYWEDIRQEISPYWQNFNLNPNRKYLKFAELFENIAANNIALLFYHISEGVLSPGKFKQLTNDTRNSSKLVYGVTIKREQSFSEKAVELFKSVLTFSIDCFIYLFKYLIKYPFKYLIKDPSKGKTSIEKKMRRFITLAITSTTLVSGIAIGNANLIRLPFIIANDSQPTRKTTSTPPSTPLTPPTSPKPSVPPRNEIQTRDIKQKTARLAGNIASIYELQKYLEQKSIIDSQDLIIKKLKINPPGDQTIKDTLNDIKTWENNNPKSHQEIKNHLIKHLFMSGKWSEQIILNILNDMDKTTGIKTEELTSITKDGGSFLKNMRNDILPEQKSR